MDLIPPGTVNAVADSSAADVYAVEYAEPSTDVADVVRQHPGVNGVREWQLSVERAVAGRGDEPQDGLDVALVVAVEEDRQDRLAPVAGEPGR
jgi:hypothetical protein